jgi:hypothetical protein
VPRNAHHVPIGHPRTADRPIGGDPSAASNTFIRDTGLPGFAIVVGRSKSSFVVEARAGRHGRNVRVTLGTVGQLPLEDARRTAKETIVGLANGVNVVAEARAKAARSITLDNALQELLATRDLKPSTVADYIRSVETLAEWRAMPLTSPRKHIRLHTTNDLVRMGGRPVPENSGMPHPSNHPEIVRCSRRFSPRGAPVWTYLLSAGYECGRPCRDRTYDQWIKSPLLYQLS